ncbi:hypothetical protein O3M35_008471 [Rhynocoris fuscipes]|uniref:BZIP domain-containing protein n=1 Tax=Rhynocoris fuscipes TaxID=488301 RepID=A0AAW1D7W9_9HEMI
MSVMTDLSLMDILFDKDEHIKLEPKSEDSKIDDKHTTDNYWENTGVDFLDSILFNQSLDFLPADEFLSHQPLNISESVSSDSGVSCDQQLSPLSYEDGVEEVDTSANSEIKIDPLSLLNTDTSVEFISCTDLTQNGRQAGLKTIKIIKPSGRSFTRKIKTEPIYEEVEIKSSSDDTGDESEQSNKNIYPRLHLTEEEKKLMIKEGIALPTHYPLTKQEERDLKRIRRKIRNKISAQDSRKRKKEYVDGLEDRVKQCSAENANLIKRVKALQCENQNLSAQLRRLQAVMLKNGSGSNQQQQQQQQHQQTGQQQQQQLGQQAQPATCLMVLVLSLALIMAPNMRGSNSARNGAVQQQQNDLNMSEQGAKPVAPIVAGRTRTLLDVSHSSAVDGFLEPPLDGMVLKRSRATNQSNHDHDYVGQRSRKRLRFMTPFPPPQPVPPPRLHPTPVRSPPLLREWEEELNRTNPGSPSNVVEIELETSDQDY